MNIYFSFNSFINSKNNVNSFNTRHESSNLKMYLRDDDFIHVFEHPRYYKNIDAF